MRQAWAGKANNGHVDKQIPPWTLGLSSDGDLMRGCRAHPRLCVTEDEEVGVFAHQFLSHLSIERGPWGTDSQVLLTCPEPRLSTPPVWHMWEQSSKVG